MRDCELYCRMGAKTSTPNPLLVHDQHVKMLAQLGVTDLQKTGHIVTIIMQYLCQQIFLHIINQFYFEKVIH